MGKKTGYLIGSKFDDHFNVIHEIADTQVKRDLFRDSKYVQSNIGFCFKEIAKLLRHNKLYFFQGHLAKYLDCIAI